VVGGDVVVAAVVVVVVAGVVDCSVVSLCLLAIHWSQLTVVEPGNSISSSRELSPPAGSQSAGLLINCAESDKNCQ